jgi:lysozyme
VKYSLNGLALTKSFEGCRLVAYQDQAGVWTIGYGHTRDVKAGDTCTQEQADKWLLEDIAFAENCVNSKVKVPLIQSQFDALVDFVFNLGCGAFRSSTLLKFVNKGDFKQASQEFKKWDHAGGKVVAGLLKRRQAEEQLFSPQPQ